MIATKNYYVSIFCNSLRNSVICRIINFTLRISSEDVPVKRTRTTRRVLNEIKWVFNLNCEGGNNIRINNTKIDSKGIKSSLTLISDEMLCLANGITF